MTARTIIRHLLAQTSTYWPMPVCRISSDNQAALAVFSQQHRARQTADERLLLCASLFAMARKVARQQLHGYHGLAEVEDFDQEGARVVLELAKVFDPSIARAFTTPLQLLLKHNFHTLAGQLERHVALSTAMHKRIRGVAWRIHDHRIQYGHVPDDIELHAIVEEVVGEPVTVETARAYRRFLRGGRYLSDLTGTKLDRSLLRGAAIISGSPSSAELTEEEALAVLTREEVVKALSGLSEKQRERIADLIGLDGMDPQRKTEIAKVLRLSRQAVHLVVNHGLRKLQNSRHRSALDQIEMQRRTLRRQRRTRAG